MNNCTDEEYLRKFNMKEWNAKEYLTKLYDKQLKDLRNKVYAGLRNMNTAIQSIKLHDHYSNEVF